MNISRYRNGDVMTVLHNLNNKQKFHDESCSDANIFFTSFVPIQLHYLKSDNSEKSDILGKS